MFLTLISGTLRERSTKVMRREAPQAEQKEDEPPPSLDEILQEIEEERML